MLVDRVRYLGVESILGGGGGGGIIFWGGRGDHFSFLVLYKGEKKEHKQLCFYSHMFISHFGMIVET